MFEIRVHGRGGQGVVTAAELLSVAAFADGHEAQAFPSFGSERMGAPVVSYCRISDVPIRLREPVFQPDAVLVIDATLLHHVDVFAGVPAHGYVLINSPRPAGDLGLSDLVERLEPGHVVTVPATELAREYLGRPLPNVCLLGGFCELTGQVSLASLESAVRERFHGEVGEANLRGARAACDAVRLVAHA